VIFMDPWAADAQRKSDERAARWQQRQRDRARTGQMTLMERWARRAQRKADDRAARWLQRQHEKAAAGRLTFMDRWAARAQRKGDDRAARWLELEPLRQLVASGPVSGPGGSTSVIRVYPTAWPWRGTVVSVGGGGGAVLLALLLVIAAIRWLVFRRSRSWTVYARTNDYPPKVHVRLASEVAAYRAAAELVSRFQAEGPAALPGWRTDATASFPISGTGQS
jgi:hypothetical protein